MTKRRLIWLYHSYLANLVSPAARKLRDEHGIATTLVCYNRSSLPVVGRHDFDPNDFEEVFELDPLLAVTPEMETTPIHAWAERAASIESRYGLSLMEAIRTDRLVGIDYVVGAWFPKSKYGKTLNYHRTVAVAVRVAEAIEALLDRVGPIALVGNSSALAPSILWRMAVARGISTRNLVVARWGSGLYWTCDDYMLPLNLSKAYTSQLEKLRVDSGETLKEEWLPSSYRSQVAVREIQRQTDFGDLVRQIVLAIRSRLVTAIRGRGRVYGTYLLRDKLRLIFSQWRWRRGLKREPQIMPSLEENTPYVFFPLQVEPESSLMLEAPMCDNSLTVVDWLSKTVPAGWYVLIKEHPAATAPRSDWFWRQIRRYPNVLIAATVEDAELIVRRAQVVAVLNGSLGIQAANLGKPVITYHPSFVGEMLNHVLVADSYESTKEALRRVRDNELPPMHQRLTEAEALRRALLDTQFAASDPQILSGVSNEDPIVPADRDAVVETLVRGLPYREGMPSRLKTNDGVV